MEVPDGHAIREFHEAVEAPRPILLQRELQAQGPEVAQRVLWRNPLASHAIAASKQEDCAERHCSSIAAQLPLEREVDSVIVSADDGSGRLEALVGVPADAQHRGPGKDRRRGLRSEAAEVFGENAMSVAEEGRRQRGLARSARPAEQHGSAVDLDGRSVEWYVAALKKAEQRRDAPETFLALQWINALRHEDLGLSGVDRVPAAVLDPEVEARVLPIQTRVKRVPRWPPLAERTLYLWCFLLRLGDFEPLADPWPEKLEGDIGARLEAEAHAIGVH
jgi:hypothetical protein